MSAPVLALSGAADQVDPSAGCRRFVGHFASTDVTFQIAGTEQGFAVDYDHPGIVVSKPARAEIWPLVADWLYRHPPGPPPARPGDPRYPSIAGVHAPRSA